VRIPERLGKFGFGGPRAGGRAVRVLGLLAILGFSLVPVASANAASFTWAGGSTGRTESAAHWSAGANWEGNTAPTTSQAIETLTFPHLTNSECTSKPPTDTCYLTLNNISGLTVNSMQLDDADNYLLAGEKITLGSGGLTATPPIGTSGFAGSFMEMPLELSASQKWSIANRTGGEIGENGLLLGSEVTGEGSELTLELSNGPALILENSTEVGPVTIEGPNASGQHIANGLVLFGEGELNSADHHSVNLRNVFFAGAGAVGALTTNNSTLDVGSATDPAGSIKASSVKLDAATGVIFEVMGSGSTAQTDYSQLVSTGSVELAGPIVVLVGKPSKAASCPVLTPGQKYTFVSTTGTLSGSFSNAPEGGSEISITFTKECSHPAQTMQIAYNRIGGTETVTGTVEEARVKREAKERQESKEGQEAKEKQEDKERQEAREKQEARERQEANERQQVKEVEARKSQEAAAAVAAKHQEEEVIIKRENEEAAAANRKHEEEAAGTGSVSLDGSTITVQSSGAAGIKLTCTGTGTCRGKLTLTAKGTAKKGKKGKTETIGTASFSIPAGTTVTIKLKLNAAGKTLLSADHGRLGATLSILKSSPAPSQTHTDSVHLVQQKAHGKAKK
jgi:hypothetical protein